MPPWVAFDIVTIGESWRFQPQGVSMRGRCSYRLSLVRGSLCLMRSHQGYRLKVRTPAQALREVLGEKKLPPMVTVVNAEEAKEPA